MLILHFINLFIYGLFASANIDLSIDSLKTRYKVKRNYAGKANQLAMQIQFNKVGNAVTFPEIKANFKKY